MATATFSPSNSSVHAWLDFNGTILPALPACQSNTSVVNCHQVCGDGASLFSDQSNSLVTCGLWTSLVLNNSDSTANGTLVRISDNSSRELFFPFQRLDLNESDFQNASLYADTISDCFESIYINVKRFSFADDGNTPAACTRHDLFPLSGSGNSLQDCVQAICSPLL